MYTIMRNIQGNRSPIDLAEYTLGDKTSTSFAEAMRFVKESTDHHHECSQADMAKLTEGQEVLHGETVTLETAAKYSQEISCVELQFHYQSTGMPPQEAISMGSRSGTRSLDEAIGVLSYELETQTNSDDPGYMLQSSRWEFIYPGDSVYVTNRYGKTVDSLR